MSPFFTLLYLTRDTTTANDESFWIVSWNIHYYCISKRKESWIVFTFYTLSLMLSYSILWFVSIYPVVIHGFEIVNNSYSKDPYKTKYYSTEITARFTGRVRTTCVRLGHGLVPFYPPPCPLLYPCESVLRSAVIITSFWSQSQPSAGWKSDAW